MKEVTFLNISGEFCHPHAIRSMTTKPPLFVLKYPLFKWNNYLIIRISTCCLYIHHYFWLIIGTSNEIIIYEVTRGCLAMIKYYLKVIMTTLFEISHVVLSY